MKTKIRQLLFLLVLFVGTSVVSANAQSPVDYQALLNDAQSRLAQYQAYLNNNTNLDPAKVTGIQNEITRLQQQITAYQGRIAFEAQPRATSSHDATLQNQQNPVLIQRQLVDQQRTQKQQAIQNQQLLQSNPAVERTAGRNENPHPVTK